MKAISVNVYRGKAYVISQGRFESGIWFDKEPIIASSLELQELIEAIKQIKKLEIEIVPDSQSHEWLGQPVALKATKARSWKALAKNGASYSIYYKDGKIHTQITYTDKKGRWQYDPQKTREFAGNTPLEDIVKYFLDDIDSRPEIL